MMHASAVSWRKVLLLHRGPLLQKWDRSFPRHDIRTLRLRWDPRDTILPDSHMDADSKVEPKVERRTPQVTVDAIVWTVSERGLAALDEPANVERLSRCDERARAEINIRIANIRKDSI
jgi:hypothetical protein